MFASLSSRWIARRIAAGLFAYCLIVMPATAQAQQAAPAQPTISPKMEGAATKLAEDIAKYLNTEASAGKNVVVESIRGPNSVVHAGMTSALKQQLEAKGFKMVTGGAFTVTGRLLIGNVEGRTSTRVNVDVLDQEGAQKHQLAAVITDTQDTINAFAPTFSNPVASSGAPAAESARIVGNAIKQSVAGNGAIFVANSQIKPDPSSPYGVELVVVDKNGFVSIPAEARDGLAVVNIQPEQEFGILIDNPTAEPIGVNVSLDGINMFEFSKVPHYRQLGKVAIGPGRTKEKAAILKGWHDIGDRSFAFKVTNYGNSKAAQLGITEGVGTITITFYRAVEVKGKGEQPALGIGAGNAVEAKFTDVPLAFTDILGAVSVRYFRPTPPPDLPPTEQPAATATR
jgi:hypothetical protein